MSKLLKIDFRRVLTVCLVSALLFLGSAIAFPQNDFAIAEVLKRDTVGISGDEILDEGEYESAKASRNREQAERSKKAEVKAEAKTDSESVAEKLNLDEIEDALSD